MKSRSGLRFDKPRGPQKLRPEEDPSISLSFRLQALYDRVKHPTEGDIKRVMRVSQPYQESV